MFPFCMNVRNFAWCLGMLLVTRFSNTIATYLPQLLNVYHVIAKSIEYLGSVQRLHFLPIIDECEPLTARIYSGI